MGKSLRSFAAPLRSWLFFRSGYRGAGSVVGGVRVLVGAFVVGVVSFRPRAPLCLGGAPFLWSCLLLPPPPFRLRGRGRARASFRWRLFSRGAPASGGRWRARENVPIYTTLVARPPECGEVLVFVALFVLPSPPRSLLKGKDCRQGKKESFFLFPVYGAQARLTV